MNPKILIDNISRHISLSGEEIEYFVSLLKFKTLDSGEHLLREGEVCKYKSFVCKGCLKNFYHDENGVEHVIDFLVEEWWADDLYSLLTQSPASSAIKAIEPTELIQLSKADLEIAYEKIPAFERFFRILFQNAYIAQQTQLNLTLSASAEERYLLFVKQKSYAEKRFTQKDIAAYLGVTPQFLSTLKKRLGRVNVD